MVSATSSRLMQDMCRECEAFDRYGNDPTLQSFFNVGELAGLMHAHEVHNSLMTAAHIIVKSVGEVRGSVGAAGNPGGSGRACFG